MKPLVEIGFMPEALSTKPQPYRHHWAPGNRLQPNLHRLGLSAEGLREVGELVYQWVRHCVERYGRDEVESWYWEVWNEPDIGTGRARPRSITSSTTTRRTA